MAEPLVDVDAVLGELKDFQRRTAEWVVKRMFDKHDPAYRFLVADEVGLGKTHVAKGVIALVLEHLRSVGDERHDIVYICSNGAIAAQNLRKLAPPGVKPLEQVDRLTMLPLVDVGHAGDARVNILAITPTTSLKFGREGGKFEERALAFAFLREMWGRPAFPERARRIFWHGAPAQGDVGLVKQANHYRPKIKRHLDAYDLELAQIDDHRRRTDRPTLREDFNELVEGLRWKREIPDHLKELRRGLIGDLRRGLATVGIQLLDPDLVILDEFQRFKDLLDADADSWAAQLANRMFRHTDQATGRPTRTLLLSATPYRMYTTSDESDEDHYADFLRTCGFLMDDPDRVGRLRASLRGLRRALADLDEIGVAETHCAAIRSELTSVMARTERLASTQNRAGMLTEPAVDLSIEAIDVSSYLRIADVAEHIHHHDPTEYWKSSPYLLNFMERYQLKQRFQEAVAAGDLPPGEDLDAGPGLLDWSAVDAYERIDPQNGRLRWLLADLEAIGAFDVLWIPPSLPYYRGSERYERARAAGLSKRLIFSGWAVVPKVVSSLLSHEAERRAFGDHRASYTTGYGARGGRRLDFDLRDRRAAAMTSFLFVWPSPSLAEAGDPRTASDPNRAVDDVQSLASTRLAARLRPLTRRAPRTGTVDQRWYWAAPLLLDKAAHPSVTDGWFGSNDVETAWSTDVASGFARHTALARDVVAGDADELGRVPDDLADVLAGIAVGGPAVCALRALAAVTGLPMTSAPILNAAARSAWGFRSLFSTPDVTALVEGHDDRPVHGFWQAAIRHCVDGNLQAVLDEHAHVLRDWLGFVSLTDDDKRAEAAGKIADRLAEALSVRTSSQGVDVPSLDAGQLTLDPRSMRTRFAVPFGTQRLEDGGEARIEALSTAFNSPFWPFVLTSTSVGQEGLDFHLWCHDVVHWNLPSNPVDLEQREGRVHRFKGHAVRRNLAARYGGEAADAGGDRWQAMFDQALANRPKGGTAMVPYWVFDEGPARIRRLAPVLPFSRDAAHLPALRKSLAAYRLAIGQPRQQELVEFLGRTLTDEQLAEVTEKLRIDLSPPLSVDFEESNQ